MVVYDSVHGLDPELQFYYVDNLSFQECLSGIDIFNVRQILGLRCVEVAE